METHVKTDPRFDGLRRLYGAGGFARVRAARVMVVGVGGVGGWVAESLARSGVGALTLVDMDEVCVTNINRQVHAHDLTVGQPKVEAMAGRVRHISPDCAVEACMRFFTAETRGVLLDTAPAVVVDAIDSIPHKCLLIEGCVQRGLPVVTVGAAGGRRDPTRVEVADLTRVHHDALLQRVRKKLRQKHDFPRNTQKPWGISAVFSPEPVSYPRSDGEVCATREDGVNLRLDCDSGYGTATHLTGTFGFAAAAAAMDLLSSEPAKP